MSWLQRLYQTYDSIRAIDSDVVLWPVAHVEKAAQVEVVLDYDGKYIPNRSRLLEKNESTTLIPVTETSSTRTGQPDAAHPLCDELSFCAGYYDEKYLKRFDAYLALISGWAASEYSHPKVIAVKKYIKTRALFQDLMNEGILSVAKVAVNKVFIRWRIEKPGENETGTWQDQSLIESWIEYEKVLNKAAKKGFCFTLGGEYRLSTSHPKFIRHPADGAKLISRNDWSGFTFRGRFTDDQKLVKNSASQACDISCFVSNKAHNALRWLIKNQGFKNGDQVVVSWAASGSFLPNPVYDSWDYLKEEIIDQVDQITTSDALDLGADIGRRCAEKLKLMMKGYRQKITDTDQLSVMTLDSATPGRMAVTYYREFMPDDYFSAIECWYDQFSWFQRHTVEVPRQKRKNKTETVWPVLSPSPLSIAQTAYGKTLSAELKKQVISRVLPCIIEGVSRVFPFDLVQLCVNRACCPTGVDKWEWERNVGVACALYKGFFARHPQSDKRRIFSMSLDENNTTRDYLYGRMLAIAEHLEGLALYLGGEKRSTTAERYMQRFAERPFTTWRNIELALVPYKDRLKKNRPGFLNLRCNEISTIMNRFDRDEFVRDDKLSGEFLLGYHCQKMFYKNKDTDSVESVEKDI